MTILQVRRNTDRVQEGSEKDGHHRGRWRGRQGIRDSRGGRLGQSQKPGEDNTTILQGRRNMDRIQERIQKGRPPQRLVERTSRD